MLGCVFALMLLLDHNVYYKYIRLDIFELQIIGVFPLQSPVPPRSLMPMFVAFVAAIADGALNRHDGFCALDVCVR